MLVDPDTLRAFAGETSRTADTVSENDLSNSVPAAFAGMPGSTSLWAANSIDAFVTGLVTNLSDGFDALATAARGSADSYQVTDQDLAVAIDKVFPR
ncbi:type VII secretion target [Gordonia sp. SL306]|uniref:type VII secretion target n=1 Tax=Gordonia sp. SL306 TaxID=2995145 RepID=UPI00226DFD04|nr:type VII secretion target [Gordonia sp. SL306]WAC57547.1 type VII secretion target [Gordonia sp. SL306]